MLAKTFPSNISQHLKFSLIPCQTKFAEITREFFFIVVVIFKSTTSLAPLYYTDKVGRLFHKPTVTGMEIGKKWKNNFHSYDL